MTSARQSARQLNGAIYNRGLAISQHLFVMWVFYLEAAGILAVVLGLVWWIMQPPR